jgi:hypothetical protein
MVVGEGWLGFPRAAALRWRSKSSAGSERRATEFPTKLRGSTLLL